MAVPRSSGRYRSRRDDSLVEERLRELEREHPEATGAELLYLPHSPDLNPTEQCWPKLKQALRSAKARSFDALQQAITDAIPTVSPNNAQAWFRHCGYSIYL
jgi:transposase